MAEGWAGRNYETRHLGENCQDSSGGIGHLKMGANPSNAPANENLRLLRRLTIFLGFIVFAIILAFCYFSAAFTISIVLSAIVSVLLDPIVMWMERHHLRRTAASGITILLCVLIFGALAYGLYQRASSFAEHLPEYSRQIHHDLGPLFSKFHKMEQGIENAQSSGGHEIQVKETTNWSSYILRGVGSLRTFLIIAGVVPFLAFFMLVRKDQMRFRVVELLEGSMDAPALIDGLNSVLRGIAFGYLMAGSAMAVVFCAVFLAVGLNGAIILGVISGFVNLIPYVGAVIALVLVLAAALLQFSSISIFLIIGLTILALHFITANVVAPRWIGPRVQVGPAAVIAGMLFFGWLWGILGILLAIPLTACLKVLADQHPRLSYFSDLLADDLHLSQRWPKLSSRSKKAREKNP